MRKKNNWQYIFQCVGESDSKNDEKPDIIFCYDFINLYSQLDNINNCKIKHEFIYKLYTILYIDKKNGSLLSSHLPPYWVLSQ